MQNADLRQRTIYYWCVRTAMMICLFPEPELVLGMLVGVRELGIEPPAVILSLVGQYIENPELKPMILRELERIAVKDRLDRRMIRQEG